MATPNYGYEKRQRELAKKRKKEDKLRAKTERKTHGPDGEVLATDTDEPSTAEQHPPVAGASAGS